jgi:hypothetical protein
MLHALPGAARGEAFVVDYQADTKCPTFEQFLGSIQGRTRDAHVAAEGEPATVFEVRLSRTEASTAKSPGQSAAEFRGSVARRGADGSDPERVREIVGLDCHEVAEALALGIALSLDPNASLVPLPEQPPPAPPLPAPKPTPVEREPSNTRGLRARAFGAAAQPVDALMLGGGIGAALTFDRPGWRSRATRGASYSRGPAFEERPVSLQYGALHVALCPLGIASSILELYLCADGSLGVLNGKGKARDETSAKTRTTSSIGGALEGGIALGAGFWLEASFALGVPLQTRRFVLEEPRQVVADTPTVSTISTIGLGFEFSLIKSPGAGD